MNGAFPVLASVAGLAGLGLLRRRGGSTNAPAVDWVYHATTASALPGIRRDGLQPQKPPVWGQPRAVYFAPTPDHALAWGSSRALLRFPWPDDWEDDAYGDTTFVEDERGVESLVRTSMRSPDPVSPELIELRVGKQWVPLLPSGSRGSSARTPVPSVLDLDASRKKADRRAALFQVHAATMDKDVLRAWGEKHGMRLLGAGESRAVFTWPPGRAILHLDPFDTSEPRRPQHAIKFAYSSYGEEANRWEATIWRDSVPSLRLLLVPVVDVDPPGPPRQWRQGDLLPDGPIDPPFGTGSKWLVMPLVERAPPGPAPMSDANCKRLESCGIMDVRHTPNFDVDGRVLDYGKVILDWWKRSPCRQLASVARR